MTIANMTRATSTLSPAPEMPQNPVTFKSTTKKRLRNCMSPASREELKDDIKRRLGNDRTAIYDARTQQRKLPGWKQLDPNHQEQKLKQACLHIIQHRKNRNIHVSSVYPEFADYVPLVGNGRSNGVDEEVVLLTNKQLDLLEHGRSRAPHHEEEEDDEEMMPPSVKKQEDDNTQEPREIPRFGRKRTARSTPLSLNDQGCSQKTSQLNNSSITTRSTVRDSSSAKSDNEDASESESGSECESESAVEADSEDAGEDGEDEEDYVPMVAVSRTLPLLKDMPASTKDTPAVKHRFSTVCTERGVSRGWVASTDDGGSDIEWVWVEKKGFTPKKRSREADVDDHDQTSKKAKVDVEA